MDNVVAPKATTAYVYGQLATKANQATTYTIAQVDTALALKANQATTYTTTQVDIALALKANAATTYTKTDVDNALAGQQPLINMLTALSVDIITAVGDINAAGFTTTGTATLGSIITDIMYVSTIIQSAGPVRVGSLTGGGVWTDTCKLEANGNITCVGTLTAPNIYTKSEVYGLLITKLALGGTAARFLKANGTSDSNTYLTTADAAADSIKLNGITAVQ